MADLPNDFWSGWIILLTVTSLAALVWLTVGLYFPSKKLMAESHEHADPVWDETLREGNHAPPLWWFWLILATLVFTVVYLILYPGLGSYKGILNWSHDSRLVGSYENYDKKFSDIRAEIANSKLSDLQSNSDLMNSAARIFSRHCGGCHREDGKGQANLFPNLKDEVWQWGGSPEQIEQTIRQGRVANMIGWQSILGDDGVVAMADYVQSLRKLTQDKQESQHAAHQQYTQTCAGCHGLSGNGNPQLGAPSFNDLTWLYGSSTEDIQESISKGRNGIMPAFGQQLDDTQIRLLVAWLTMR